MRILLWLVVNAGALAVAVWLLDGITLTADSTSGRIGTLLVVGAIFGAITAVVAPVVKLLSLPLIILTLGLMLLVINALMLLLTSKVAGSLGLGFHVSGFWTAVLGAIVISIASMILEALLPDRA